MLIGRAAVVPRPPQTPQTPPYTAPAGPPARVRPPLAVRMRSLKRGGGWTIAGGVFATLCWIIWASANRSKSGVLVGPTVFLTSLVVAAGVFVVLRLVGRLVIETWMHKTRRGALGAHVGTAIFLFAVGVTYLQQTSWVVTFYRWLKGLH